MSNQEKPEGTGQSNGTGRNNRRKRMGRNNRSSNLITTSFKGKVKGMNGNTFVCHGETTAPTQYTDTMEELGRYASHTYKYGEDIQDLVRTLKETVVVKPAKVEEDDKDPTNKRIWEKQVDEYVKRLNLYESNKKGLYSVIWDQCSPALQARMESLNDYNDIERRSDCLKLLQEIRSSVYQFETQAYIHESMLKTKEDLYRMKQKEDESTNDYRKRFREQLEMIRHYQGSFGDDIGLIRDEYRRQGLDGEKEDRRSDSWPKMEKLSIDRAQGMAFLRNANTQKYGLLMIDLANQFSRKNDQYPSNLTEAYNLLVNFKSNFTEKRFRQRDKKRDEKKKVEESETETVLAQVGDQNAFPDILCYNCDTYGHYANDCSKPDKRKSDEVAVQLLNHHIYEDSGSESDGLDFTFCIVEDQIDGILENMESPDFSEDNSSTDGSMPELIYRYEGYDSSDDDSSDDDSSDDNYSDNYTSDDDTILSSTLDITEGFRRAIPESSTGKIVTTNTVDREEESSLDSNDETETICTILAKKEKGRLNSNWILLDSQSTISIFCSAFMLKNIRKVQKGMEKRCYCNGGIQDNDMIGDLDGFGIVYYNPNAIANILSLAEVVRVRRVTYDSEKGNTFRVLGGKNGVIEFTESRSGLFFWDCSTKASDGIVLVNSVKENEKRYSRREVKSAREAKRLGELLGYPSSDDVNSILVNNLIRNCPVTASDYRRAIEIYGPELGNLKGKTTRRRSELVKTEVVIPVPESILALYSSVTLCADIFFVDNLIFLGTIARKLKYITATQIDGRKHKVVLPVLLQIIALYKARGFKVEFVLTDGEFTAMETKLLEYGILLNGASANEHVPEIERLIRTVKERHRAKVNTLPYNVTKLPKIFKIQSVLQSVLWLNMFPRRDGVSETLSPHSLLRGRHVDFAVHCRIPFGAYCEVHEEPSPSNTSESRTTGAIALGPNGNLQGGYFFLSLKTGKKLNRRNWTELPVTPEIIKLVEEMGERESKRGKKISDTNFSENIGSEVIFRDRDGVVVEALIMELPEPNVPGESVEEETEVVCEELTEYPPDGDDPIILASEEEGNNLSPSENTPESLNDNVSINDESDMENKDDNSECLLEDSLDEEVSDDPDKEALDDPDEEVPDDLEEEEQELSSEDNNIEVTVEEMSTVERRGGLRPKKPVTYDHRYDHTMAIVMTQMSVKKGIMKFGEKAVDAVTKEFTQLDEKGVLIPKHFSELTQEERTEALPAIVLIKEKRNGVIKGRACADGRKQRLFIPPEETTSPTVSTEGLMLSCVLDAAEERFVATCDIVGAYLHAEMQDKVYMLIRNEMVDILVKANPSKYTKYVHKTKKGGKIIYVLLGKALYGCLKSARLFWEHLKKVLKRLGFKLNDYDNCVANKNIDGSQCTITWHVDDLKISHRSRVVVSSVIKSIEEVYGKMSVTEGDEHEYVGMVFRYLRNEKAVEFDMRHHLEEALEMFTGDTGKNVNSPAAIHLFEVNENCEKLNEKDAALFHSTVAKLLFVSKRARPDIMVAIAFLTTRVSKSDKDDWKKLERLLSYIRGSIGLTLILSASSTSCVKWWVDASYGVHPDMRSHTGGSLSLGRGSIYSKSSKQKLNSKSSTEAELIAASEVLPQILWTRHFLLEQGCQLKESTLFQDNTSAIQMENNGRASAGQRSRHINIRYFFIKDRVDKGEVTIIYCPTDEMVADFYTKPLQGIKFTRFRELIMGTIVMPIIADTKESVTK